MNLKSRLKIIKMSWTEGREEAIKMGLGDDMKNWTPLLLHVYHIGLIAGLITIIPLLIGFITLLVMLLKVI